MPQFLELDIKHMMHLSIDNLIQLLEYPIPAPPAAARPSQKASHGDISETKRGVIDLLVSKQSVKNGQNVPKWSKLPKMV